MLRQPPAGGLFLTAGADVQKDRIEVDVWAWGRGLESWLLATLRNCTRARYAINKSRMLRLAEYSLECLVALRGETGIAYDERSRGTLQLFRTQQQLDGIAKDVAVLEADNVPYEVLDAAGCMRAEPGWPRSDTWIWRMGSARRASSLQMPSRSNSRRLPWDRAVERLS